MPCVDKEKRRAYNKAYWQRPDVIEKKKKYEREYRNRPEAIESKKRREQARRKLPEAKLKQREYNLIINYGITLKEYDSLYARQNGKCAICGTEQWGDRGPFVDHDHDTGEVRGILCSKCNYALGLFGDSLTLITLAAEYLKKSGAKT